MTAGASGATPRRWSAAADADPISLGQQMAWILGTSFSRMDRKASSGPVLRAGFVT
jgi:hypothetical protein